MSGGPFDSQDEMETNPLHWTSFYWWFGPDSDGLNIVLKLSAPIADQTWPSIKTALHKIRTIVLNLGLRTVISNPMNIRVSVRYLLCMREPLIAADLLTMLSFD